MPLKVALLENIFWNNGSYNKPATIPNSEKFVEIKVTPTMFSPYSGVVSIKGDYNYAEFNGSLFFLSPIELVEQSGNLVKYLLTRDEWAFAVKNKIKLTGTVVKTLDEKLLTENIQLTQPAIQNAAKLNIINLFQDEDYSTVVVDPVQKAFPETYLSGLGVEDLITTTSKDYLGLYLSFADNWKNLLIPYIKELTDGIRNKKYMLSKVSQIESSFKHFWCFTPDDQSTRIGNIKEEGIYIENIDLSGLRDIRALSITQHLNPAVANKKIDNKRSGTTRIRKYDLETKDLGDRLEVIRGSETLLDGQLFKYKNNYYVVQKNTETFLVNLPFPSSKEIWDRNTNPWDVNLEKDLNLLDAKIRQNIVYTFDTFYSATRKWIKSISPNFQNEDLNAPLPRREDGSFDADALWKDYFGHTIYYDLTNTPTSSGYWAHIKTSKPRPKFWYELYGSWFKQIYNDPFNNITRIASRIHEQISQLRNLTPKQIKDTIFNAWYRFRDNTFTEPEGIDTLGKIYSIDKKTLETGGHLFDLVGTDYLLLIYKNKPHLIFQNAQIRTRGKRLSINSEEAIPNLSLFEYINQNSVLQVYGKSFPLRDKITKSYQFNTEIKTITHPDSISYDYAFIKHQGYLDSICEAIEFPKLQLASGSSVSAADIENNYISQQRNHEDLQLKRREVSLRRSNEDLEWNFRWEEYSLKRASSLVTLALGIGGLGIAAKGAKAATNLIATAKGALTYAGMNKAVGGAFAGIGSDLEYWKLKEAEQQQLQARLLENYRLELTHHRFDYDLKRNLKNMGNVAQAASVTYRTVMQKYGSEIGADEIHLRMWTPTELQMQTITNLYKEAGVDCLIGNTTIQIDSQLSGIWRFSLIDSVDSEDGMSISFLTSLFENGVRIVPNDVIFKQPIETIQGYLLPENIQRELDILRRRVEESTTIERVYKGLITYGDKQLIQEKDEEIIELREKIAEFEKADTKEKFEQCKKELDERLTKFEVDEIVKTEVNKIWNQAIATSRITFRQNAKLQSEIIGKDQQLEEAKSEISTLRDNYAKKEEAFQKLLKERNKFAEDLRDRDEKVDQRIRNLEAEKLLIIRDMNNILAELAKGGKVTITNVTREVQTSIEPDTLRDLNKRIDDNNKQILDAIKDKQDIEECKNQLTITRRIIEEKQRTILAQAKEIENYKKGTGANPALLNCLQKRYENTYSRLIQTSRWVFEAILMFGELCNDINPIVSEMAQNTWSNSKSWAWTLKWLVDYWVAKVWIKLGAYQESGTDNATKNIISPFAKMYISKRIGPIGEVNKFLRWFTLTGELKEFDKSLTDKRFQRIRNNKEITDNIYSWTQLLGPSELRRGAEWFGLSSIQTYQLNQNYPNYNTANFETTNSWSLFLELKESGNYPSLKEVHSAGGMSTNQLVAELHKLIYADERNKPWEVVKPDEFLNCAEQPENVRAEVIKVAPEAEKIVPDDAQVKWIECEAENLKLKEEIERLKQPRQEAPENYQELQLIKEQAEKAIKELSEGRNLNIANYPNLNKSHLEEINKKAIWKNNQIKDKTDALTTCTNNLNRMRQEYSELEAENTQNKNQATLYRQESEQFKRERDEARNFFRSSPMPDNDRTRTSGTIGLGRNFANMFKNTKNINYSITAIHTDYSNRVRSKSQTMANLGYYFNYLIDDILKVLDTYLGDKEKAYLTSKKINEGNLRGLRQKRDASNEKPPEAPKIVGLDDF